VYRMRSARTVTASTHWRCGDEQCARLFFKNISRFSHRRCLVGESGDTQAEDERSLRTKLADSKELVLDQPSSTALGEWTRRQSVLHGEPADRRSTGPRNIQA
jgi:hypothetical protein